MQYQNYPKAKDELVPGTWKDYATPKGTNLLIECPNGHVGSLEYHTVGESGSVSPSYVCPKKDCSFHEWIHLEGF